MNYRYLENNVERERAVRKKINKNVHYSTSGLKKEPNVYNELSTKEHKNIISATISPPQNPNELTKKKEYGNIKNNRNRARQDLEIMKIFTSPEWSRKTFQKTTNSIVNSIIINDTSNPLVHTKSENAWSKTYNEAESMEDPIQEITDQETEETDDAGEQKIVLIPEESFHSVRQFPEAEEKVLENNLRESITESIVENRNSIESFEVSSFNSKVAEHEYDVSFEAPEDNIIMESDSGPLPSYITPDVEMPEKTLKEIVDESCYGSNEVEENENQVEDQCYIFEWV